MDVNKNSNAKQKGINSAFVIHLVHAREAREKIASVRS
jgi:hypothetical protein